MAADIWIFKPIDSEMAQYVCFEIESAHEVDMDEIIVYINSSGGDIYNGLAILNSMMSSKIPIRTRVCGMACSAALPIAACGTKGRRECYSNSIYMYHDVQVGLETVMSKTQMIQYSDSLDKVTRCEHDILKRITNFTDDDINRIERSGHEVYFSIDEVLKYGIADKVLDYGNRS